MKRDAEFRADIAGLRAVAVILVVLYHYGFPHTAGGFIGVDVFFVISGYLITKSIADATELVGIPLKSMLVQFYYRRVRRITPALLATLLATLVAGWFILAPADYALLGTSTAYSAVGAANFYFYWNTGYFDRAAELQPLLHMWSLGVEEQFYLLWPVIVAIVLGATKGNRAAIATITGSLVVTGWWYSFSQASANLNAAFYWPHARAWELAVGALLVFLPPVKSETISQTMCITGLGAIVWSAFSLTGTTTSTASHMIAPVGGAALVVWPRVQGVMDRALSVAPMLVIGNISYSLYLVHWPLLVLFRHYNEGVPDDSEAVILGIVALALAYLLWRFVEQPFLVNGRVWDIRRVYCVLPPIMVATAASGAFIAMLQGMPSRFPPSEQKPYHFAYAGPYQEGKCFLMPEQSFHDYDTEGCISSERPAVFLWGDSYAAHYHWGFATSFAASGLSISQITASGCAPIRGLSVRSRPNCQAFNDYALQTILRIKPELVVLSALWWPSDAQSLAQLSETIEILSDAGVPTALLGQGPYYQSYVPEILSNRASQGDERVLSGDEIDAHIFQIDDRMRQLFSQRVLYVSILDHVCSSDGCPMAIDNEPLHWDNGHLTTVGSEYFASKIMPIIFEYAFQPSRDD